MIRRIVTAVLIAALMLCAGATGLAADAADEQTSEAAEAVRDINIDINNTNININGVPWTGSWYACGPMSVGYLMSGLYAPYGSLYVVDSAGHERPCDAPVATGDSIVWYDAAGNRRTTEMVVKGDVLGTGVLSIAQLVRMAQALNGIWPLYGPYELAADLNGNGYIDISDLVMEAELLW